MEPATDQASPPAAPPTAPPQPAAKPRRDEFRGGERVIFEDRSGQVQVGTIARVNRQSATIHTDDGKIWRVSFSLLRHIVDV